MSPPVGDYTRFPSSFPPYEGDDFSDRPLGHKKDELDPRDKLVGGQNGSRPIGNLIPPGEPLPSAVLLPTAPIRDQGHTSECVAFTFARMINARLAFLLNRSPDKIVYPSEQAIYNVAREGDPTDELGNFLDDEGCHPRKALNGMRKIGIVAEARFPFDSTRPNQPIPWDVAQAGFDAKILHFHYVQEAAVQGNESFLDELTRLLASGFCIPFAQEVDASLSRYKSGEVLGPIQGPTRGGHYTLIKGYDLTRRIFFCDNSWGTSYGDKGSYVMSFDRACDPQCSDFAVPTILPDVRNIL